MSTLRKYLDTNFPGFILEPPVFYNWKPGLRFELGAGPKGENYFKTAVRRAVKLFETAMRKNDEILVVYVEYKNVRKLHKNSYLFKNIKDLDQSTVEYERYVDSYDEEEDDEIVFTRAVIKTTPDKIEHTNILTAISNTDFASRRPQIGGSVYFINTTRDLIYFMYDDRGLDIIATEATPLAEIYHKFESWVLAESLTG